MQKHLTAPGKGLLAIDESNATAGKRPDHLGSRLATTHVVRIPISAARTALHYPVA